MQERAFGCASKGGLYLRIGMDSSIEVFEMLILTGIDLDECLTSSFHGAWAYKACCR